MDESYEIVDTAGIRKRGKVYEKIEKYKHKLKSALDAEGITYTNRFYFLGYNAPYEVFNRKNEVIVELRDEALDLEKTIN